MGKNKGITLIALVITIIVLLILAAVSIATLTGENGILSQANKAKNKTEQAHEKEQIQLAYMAVKSKKMETGDNTKITVEDLNDEFNNDGVEAQATDAEEGKIKVTFSKTGNEYEIDKNGDVGEKIPLIEATSIEVEDLKLNGKDNAKLKVTTIPDKITEELEYTSKNMEIATVDNTGIVTGVAKGKATIEVVGKISKVKSECTVTVDEGVGIKVTLENKPYTNNGTAIIPVGFCIVPGCNNVEEGLVISDNDEDTEKNKDNIVAKGNQFVWVPVTDADSYKKNITYNTTDVSERTKNDTGYLPDGINVGEVGEKTLEELTFEKEKELVTKKEVQGFYISRYEAGDGSAIEKRTSDTNGQLVSKKDAYAYIFISQEDAKAKAKEFIDNKNVKSALATGVQWDMAMAFISSKPRLDGKNQPYDVTTYSPNRHTKNIDNTGKNEYDRVCNIYDLEGNCSEYIAEKRTDNETFPYVVRGGFHSSSGCASLRCKTAGYYGGPDQGIAFRFVLYVM